MAATSTRIFDRRRSPAGSGRAFPGCRRRRARRGDRIGDLDDGVTKVWRRGAISTSSCSISPCRRSRLSGLMYLRAEHPDVPVVVVSASGDRGVIRRCIDFGASGFIPKTHGYRGAAQRHPACPGRRDLDAAGRRPERARRQGDRRSRASHGVPDAQQVRVLMMVSAGLLNKQIAYELSVSKRR